MSHSTHVKGYRYNRVLVDLSGVGMALLNNCCHSLTGNQQDHMQPATNREKQEVLKQNSLMQNLILHAEWAMLNCHNN